MNTNETVEIADLEEVNADAIKGGPRLVIIKAGSAEEEGLADLEPTGDVVGGTSGATGSSKFYSIAVPAG